MCGMNIFDIAIIIFLIVGALTGFVRGFIKETVIFVGTIVVVISAFMLKDIIAVYLYEHLPFVQFGGFFKGITSLNIIFYEIIGFIIALVGLSIILKILIWITGIVEKLLKMTIVLGIVSKLLGSVVGVLHAYVGVFILLFILSFPVFNIKELNESKYKDQILNNTPVLSDTTKGVVKSFTDIFNLKEHNTTKNRDELDKAIFDILIKNGVTVSEKMIELAKEGKINISEYKK
jgi:membrane protein required for colicin V production